MVKPNKGRYFALAQDPPLVSFLDGGWTRHSAHQSLIMEGKTFSETLIAREDCIANLARTQSLCMLVEINGTSHVPANLATF
jgi:hypothetical protein